MRISPTSTMCCFNRSGQLSFCAMQIGDFAREYRGKTDEEIVRLAMDSDHLTSEAHARLTNELARRGINAEQIADFRQEKLRGTGAPERAELIAPPSGFAEKNSYTLGPPSPSETPKPPWRPKTTGRIAFFFGPIAGALLVAISLRRMGYQQGAKKVIILALTVAVAESALLFFVPEAVSRLVGFGAEIAFLLIFPVLMEKEFMDWQVAHPSARPSSGWKAIGWGIVGTVSFFLIAFVVFMVLGALLPAGK
jgi:hypothetical protein